MVVVFLNSIFLSNDLNEIITTTQQCISLSLKQGIWYIYLFFFKIFFFLLKLIRSCFAPFVFFLLLDKLLREIPRMLIDFTTDIKFHILSFKWCIYGISIHTNNERAHFFSILTTSESTCLLCPKRPVFYLEDNSTKSLNKKYHREHKTLVLTVVFFVKGFGWVVFKIKYRSFWT